MFERIATTLAFDGDTTVAEVPMGGVNYDTTASYIASICNVPKLDDK